MSSYVLGEFEREEALLGAARALKGRPGTTLDIHSPYPLHGTDEALGLKRSTVPLVTLVAGVTGAVSGYFMQYWLAAVEWPMNVGGRPAHSAPSFIPITFELGVLFAAFTIFIGLLGFYFGFPRVHHPVFEVEEFRSASIDALWISAEVDSDAEAVAAELRKLGARQVSIVPEARS
jgi:hypothetical protein